MWKPDTCPVSEIRTSPEFGHSLCGYFAKSTLATNLLFALQPLCWLIANFSHSSFAQPKFNAVSIFKLKKNCMIGVCTFLQKWKKCLEGQTAVIRWAVDSNGKNWVSAKTLRKKLQKVHQPKFSLHARFHPGSVSHKRSPNFFAFLLILSLFGAKYLVEWRIFIDVCCSTKPKIVIIIGRKRQDLGQTYKKLTVYFQNLRAHTHRLLLG